jgi:hypothetical protein
MHYLNGALAGTAKNEHKIQENLGSRNFKLEFHCKLITK